MSYAHKICWYVNMVNVSQCVELLQVPVVHFVELFYKFVDKTYKRTVSNANNFTLKPFWWPTRFPSSKPAVPIPSALWINFDSDMDFGIRIKSETLILLTILHDSFWYDLLSAHLYKLITIFDHIINFLDGSITPIFDPSQKTGILICIICFTSVVMLASCTLPYHFFIHCPILMYLFIIILNKINH